MYAEPRFLAAGETGLVVEFSDRVDEAANSSVHRLDARVRGLLRAGDSRMFGLSSSVPTYRSLLLRFDPGLLPRRRLESVLRQALEQETRAGTGGGAYNGTGRRIRLPVSYEGEHAPDLAEVAQMAGISQNETIQLHAGAEYLVHMLGFQIGYPYMASLHPKLRFPRLARPRLVTPLGAVAIADELTGVYSLASPGGWRVIGNTPVRMWDLEWDPPSLLRAGDRVSFYRISPEEHRVMTESGWVPPEAEVATATGPGSGEQADGHSVPAVRVIRPGLHATVQDLGRSSYERYGCGPGGAMDRFALRVGNRLLRNPEGAAAIEVTAGAAEFEFLQPRTAVWTGGAGAMRIDGRQAPPWTVLMCRPGQRLVVDFLSHGFRGYLCLGGGVAVTQVLGSRSTNLAAGFGGLEGRPLRAGDVIPAYSHTGKHPDAVGRAALHAVVAQVYEQLGEPAVRIGVAPGPQDDRFGPEAREALYGPVFRVGNESNRMGYRLTGPEVRPTGGPDIVSDGIVAGAIQVPGNGQPMLLMADHQTTGGYTKAGVVVAADLPLAGQLRPGDGMVFSPVELCEAERLYRQFEDKVARAAGDLVELRLTIGGIASTVSVDRGR